MKTPLLLLGSLVALTVAGCGGSDSSAADPSLLVSCDFDTLAGWLPEAQSGMLSRDKAHSGRYAIKVEPGHDYSLSYKAPLGQLHETRVKKIKVTAWAFVPTADAKASLVVTVGNSDPANDKPLMWDAVEVNSTKDTGKWTEVSKEFTIPDNAMPTSPLGVYLWRTGGSQPVYLDDLRIKAVE
ncbi:carbohydrate binding domain-containing protein [Hymenobacter rubidus]|uniref:carbohydrate binding domain-containing protein n=1 Tax=Hymenobacter rubidus TaxID=1441626 RepID=UPI00191F82C6|nr:carbohydrate binding domain-containing protein [Hymenobacter rubidus]